MVKLNRIYTRTGDAGTTGLVDGSRLSKADPLMEAIGDVDEANCALGLALLHLAEALRETYDRVQNELFDLGADLATPFGAGEDPEWALRVTDAQVSRLEAEIDGWNEGLGALASFILPGGSAAVAALHLARAVTRRAERAAVAAGATRPLNPAAMAYLNRLSDHLFVACRVAAGGDEVLWVPGASR